MAIQRRNHTKDANSKDRMLLELTRRLEELHHRRERLTTELQAINNALFSLDKQISQSLNFKV